MAIRGVEISYEFNQPPLVLDASPSQTHQRDIDVTEHPVETGSAVTDHVRPKPRVLKLDGVSLDANAYDTLRRIMERSRLLIVRTSVETYENMLLVSLTVPRDASTGDALRFSATFRQLVFAESERVTIRLPQKKVDRGDQATKTAAAATAAKAERGKSFLAQFSDWSGGRRR